MVPAWLFSVRTTSALVVEIVVIQIHTVPSFDASQVVLFQTDCTGDVVYGQLRIDLLLDHDCELVVDLAGCNLLVAHFAHRH